MPLKTISLRRPLTSYAKVRSLIGHWIRNRKFQLRRARVVRSAYLDLGCGPKPHDAFINLDFLWHPQIDVCWDISRGLPFPDRSMRGVFSEHCLEHFSSASAAGLFREIRRVLHSDGVLRLVVPDAELYLRTYVGQLEGQRDRRFPYQATESQDPLWTPLQSVNRVFYQDRASPFGHRTMYDFPMLQSLLARAGFDRVTRCEFGQGSDPVLLIDSPPRRLESLYVEACPGRRP